MKVTFDESTHTYRDKGGLIVPSVTQILSEFGIIDMEKMKFATTGLGSAVHKACELDDNGTLDESILHPRVACRLEQWRLFKEEKKVEVFINEESMISKLGYAGTPDKVVQVFSISDGKCVEIDIKTSKIRSKSTKTQLFAYKSLIRDYAKIEVDECWEVYLGENEYKVIKHEDPYNEHWNAFKNMVSLHYYKKGMK